MCSPLIGNSHTLTMEERLQCKEEIRYLCQRHNVSILEIPETTRIEAIRNANVTFYFDSNTTFQNHVPANDSGWMQGTPNEVVKHLDWPYAIMTSTQYVKEPVTGVYSPVQFHPFGAVLAFDEKVSDLRFLISLLFNSPLINQLHKINKDGKAKTYRNTIDDLLKRLNDWEAEINSYYTHKTMKERIHESFRQALALVMGTMALPTREEHEELLAALL